MPVPPFRQDCPADPSATDPGVGPDANDFTGPSIRARSHLLSPERLSVMIAPSAQDAPSAYNALMQPVLSLRERQRRESLNVIHRAALEVVDESDLTSATIDAIIERAGVSRRTFFNYYASKEDALLGTIAPSIPDAALEEFFDEQSTTDQFTRTLRLISAIMQTTRKMEGSQAAELRRLLARFPELRGRVQQHAAAAERLVEGVLTEHFSRTTPDSAQAADSAHALLLLASAVLRFAYSRDPGVLATPDSESVKSAVAVFKAALADVDSVSSNPAS